MPTVQTKSAVKDMEGILLINFKLMYNQDTFISAVILYKDNRDYDDNSAGASGDEDGEDDEHAKKIVLICRLHRENVSFLTIGAIVRPILGKFAQFCLKVWPPNLLFCC